MKKILKKLKNIYIKTKEKIKNNNLIKINELKKEINKLKINIDNQFEETKKLKAYIEELKNNNFILAVRIEEYEKREEKFFKNFKEKEPENKCKICGSTCGINDICANCKEDIERGKIKMCKNCGNYLLPMQHCNCQQEQITNNDYINNSSNLNFNIESEKRESAFSKSVGYTFGSGVGCLLTILCIIGIIFFIIITTINS